MKTYKLSDIKKVCETIYGRPIGDSTWRRWKQKLQFTPYETSVSESKMEQLLTLANMKRKNPYQQIILSEVIKQKTDTLKTFSQTEQDYKLYLVPETCKGKEIRDVIYMVTGRKLHRNSLYRYGLKVQIPFSANRKYRKDEVCKMISEIL